MKSVRKTPIRHRSSLGRKCCKDFVNKYLQRCLRANLELARFVLCVVASSFDSTLLAPLAGDTPVANKSLFQSIVGSLLPKTDALNSELAPAYALDPKHALAQYAATGCLNSTFYASADEQLASVLQLAMTPQIAPEFVARVALYARSRGHMKDLPALLCAVLSVRSPGLLAEVFDRVIDDARMLRNFVQIMRSGVVGRKSLGSLPKRMIIQWLEARSDEQIFFGSVGNDPSLADVIKMVHPKPDTASRAALYGYLIGREHDRDALPEIVKMYEKFKNNTNPGKVAVPDVPFQLLTALPLTDEDWTQIAHNAPWQTTRMNLNTFQRHGVFNDAAVTEVIARRLCNPRLIEKARVFPYQLLVAFLSASSELPNRIREALQDAMEIALGNVPRIDGKVFVFPDVSGSMRSPVTGHRKGSTTAVQCVHIAALVAAAIVRRNPDAEVLPFETDVVKVAVNPRDSVMTNATRLASVGGGGTNCSAPLRVLNERRAIGDVVIYVSDNESWVDAGRPRSAGATETMKLWSIFKQRNRGAKMICIDIQPNAHSQAKEQSDIINVGGFSDQVFRLIADVASSRADAGHWVKTIESVSI